MRHVVILMSAYQGESYLEEQIDSILEQDYTDWELIVADDGSKDNTLLVLSAYANAHPDRIFVRRNEKNLGATYSFLTLLCEEVEKRREHGGEDVCYMFADQDDVWHRDKIRLTMQRMCAMEKKYGRACPVLVHTDATVISEKGNHIADSLMGMQKLNARDHRLSHLLMENVCQGCTMMLNTALAKQIQITENIRYHDWWIALIARACGHISYLKVPSMDYRLHENNVVGAHGFAAYFRQRINSSKQREERLWQTYLQGAAFYELYRKQIADERELSDAKAFAGLAHVKKAERIGRILKHRFVKSGLIRNVGVIVTIIFQKREPG